MKQKGQGIIEFAIIAPLLLAMGVAIVYVGIMFLDYTQYSNAARDAARDISIQTKFITDETLDPSSRSRKADAMRQDIADALNGGSNYENMVKKYQQPFTKIYEPTWHVQFYKWENNEFKKANPNKAQGAKAVEVTIGMKFKDDVEAGSYMHDWFYSNFGTLPPITYKMVLEE